MEEIRLENRFDSLDAHPLAGRFNDLTPEAVLDAVETDDRRCTGRFIILNSYENRVYQLELEDESWVVGKFYRPGRWSKETILAEHEFLFELESVEIPAVCPLRMAESTVGEINGILFSIFPRVGGRTPDELNDEQVRMLGRLIGRIHNIGALHDTPHRLRLDPVTYGEMNLLWLLDNDCIPAEAREAYAVTATQLIDHIKPMFQDVPMHRIHGDCHVGNLIGTRDGFAFLDFDDMAVGPAAQDIWMPLPSYDEYGARQRELLLESYREFREFDPAWLKLIEPLRALRFIHYSTWIARRMYDPIFQKTFDYFGTLQYWQKEVQDLREQLARIMYAADAGQGW